MPLLSPVTWRNLARTSAASAASEYSNSTLMLTIPATHVQLSAAFFGAKLAPRTHAWQVPALNHWYRPDLHLAQLRLSVLVPAVVTPWPTAPPGCSSHPPTRSSPASTLMLFVGHTLHTRSVDRVGATVSSAPEAQSVVGMHFSSPAVSWYVLGVSHSWHSRSVDAVGAVL